MRRFGAGSAIAVTLLGGLIATGIATQTWAKPVRDEKVAPVPVPLPTTPPAGAVILFDGSAVQLRDNWYGRYTKESPKWTANGGIATPAKSDIVSRQEFGDCYVHAEFLTPTEGSGNAGIGLQGRYEVQILGDFGKEPESHGAGALYSQKAPRVNASKKSGEWQTYDIIFRAPRFDATGKLSENPRATVFLNGILVQNNEEFTGMTGIQYGEYKEMTKTGPLILQGDHDVVQFRNVWVLPM